MKKQIKFFLFLIVMLPGGGCFHASASDFVKVIPGAKSAAMGNTGVTFTGIESMYLNPAGLTGVDCEVSEFSHIRHFEEIIFNYVGVAFPLKFGAAGFSFLYMDIPEFQGYDEWGFKTKKIKSSGNIFNLGLSFNLWEDKFTSKNISLGISGKYITERLDTRDISSPASDAGLLYQTNILDNEIRIGISVKNLSQDNLFSNAALQAGISCLTRFLNKDLFMSVESSAKTQNLGIEYELTDFLSARAGLKKNPGLLTSVGFSYGIAMKISKFTFEYSNNAHSELDISHRFSIKVFFQSAEKEQSYPEEVFEKGMDLYSEGRYAEAMLEFNRVIELDPLNKEALEMLKDCYSKIK
ncbi:MAG: hypothetical protein AB1633_04700 [Elusimicrobiota bacterium]